MILSILNTIFLLAFLAFAYVNFNDPDAWLWVSIYLVAAICCGLAIFKKYYPYIYLAAIGFYLLYAIRLFFVTDGVRDWIVKYRKTSLAESMRATKPYI